MVPMTPIIANRPFIFSASITCKPSTTTNSKGRNSNNKIH